MADEEKARDKNKEKEKAPEKVTPPNKQGRSRMVPVLVVCNLLTVAIAAAIFLMRPKGGEPMAAGLERRWNEDPSQASEAQEGPAKKIDLGPTAPFGPFVVNLDEPGIPRFLKLSTDLELDSKNAVEEVKTRSSQLRDAVILYLSNLRLEQTQGVQAKEEIRHNVHRRLNNVLKSGKVVRVYITEFMVQ